MSSSLPSNNVSSRVPDCLDDVALHAFWTGVRCPDDPVRRVPILPRREDLFEAYRRAEVRADSYLRMLDQLMSA